MSMEFFRIYPPITINGLDKEHYKKTLKFNGFFTRVL